MTLNASTFASLLTFTRGSTATYFDSTGTLQTAAVDTPRFDYDPVTHAALGLLIEESRTNLLTYSDQFDNAAWVTSTGGTGAAPIVTPNAAIAPDGNMTADQVTFDSGAGTSVGDQSVLQQSLTSVVGNDYAGGIWVRGSVGGEVLVLRHVGSAGYAELALTTEWQRLGRVETASVASTDFEIGIRQGVVGTINASATVFLWGAQCEAGSFATSYIPTTSAAVTRAADVCYRTLGTEYNSSAGTMVLSFDTLDTVSAPPIAAFGPVAVGSYIALSVGRVDWDSSGLALSGSLSSSNKIAGSWSSSGQVSGCFNGGTVATSSASDWSGTSTNLYIGSRPDGASYLNGHIKSLTYYPTRLSDADLQALTA